MNFNILKVFKLFFIFFFVLFLGEIFYPNNFIYANENPREYTWQKAYFNVEGPVVFGLVVSGVMRKYVIGYKNWGVLSQNSDHINVYIKYGCLSLEGNKIILENRIRLEKEWNNTGFISPGLWEGELAGESFIKDYKNRCAYDDTPTIQLAFYNSRGEWDSKFGHNYQINIKNLFNSPPYIFRSERWGGVEIEMDIWDYIISIMGMSGSYPF